MLSKHTCTLHLLDWTVETSVEGIDHIIDKKILTVRLAIILHIFWTEPVFSNIYGAQEPIPRNEFRQPM
jgi:hypothetical protein